MQSNNSPSLVDELSKLSQLREGGALSLEEYEALKTKLIASADGNRPGLSTNAGVRANSPSLNMGATDVGRGKGFGEAISSGFSNYATFRGRASRSEYWFFVLFTFLLTFTAGILDVALDLEFTPDSGTGPFYLIAALATIIPGFSVMSRRLHDTDHSFWWVLLYFTVIGIVVLLIWFFSKGTTGQNRFGADPLASHSLQ